MNALDLIALDAIPPIYPAPWDIENVPHWGSWSRYRALLIGSSDKQNGNPATDRALIYSRSGILLFDSIR